MACDEHHNRSRGHTKGPRPVKVSSYSLERSLREAETQHPADRCAIVRTQASPSMTDSSRGNNSECECGGKAVWQTDESARRPLCVSAETRRPEGPATPPQTRIIPDQERQDASVVMAGRGPESLPTVGRWPRASWNHNGAGADRHQRNLQPNEGHELAHRLPDPIRMPWQQHNRSREPGAEAAVVCRSVWSIHAHPGSADRHQHDPTPGGPTI